MSAYARAALLTSAMHPVQRSNQSRSSSTSRNQRTRATAAHANTPRRTKSASSVSSRGRSLSASSKATTVAVQNGMAQQNRGRQQVLQKPRQQPQVQLQQQPPRTIQDLGGDVGCSQLTMNSSDYSENAENVPMHQEQQHVAPRRGSISSSSKSTRRHAQNVNPKAVGQMHPQQNHALRSDTPINAQGRYQMGPSTSHHRPLQQSVLTRLNETPMAPPGNRPARKMANVTLLGHREERRRRHGSGSVASSSHAGASVANSSHVRASAPTKEEIKAMLEEMLAGHEAKKDTELEASVGVSVPTKEEIKTILEEMLAGHEAKKDKELESREKELEAREKTVEEWAKEVEEKSQEFQVNMQTREESLDQKKEEVLEAVKETKEMESKLQEFKARFEDSVDRKKQETLAAVEATSKQALETVLRAKTQAVEVVDDKKESIDRTLDQHRKEMKENTDTNKRLEERVKGLVEESKSWFHRSVDVVTAMFRLKRPIESSTEDDDEFVERPKKKTRIEISDSSDQESSSNESDNPIAETASGDSETTFHAPKAEVAAQKKAVAEESKQAAAINTSAYQGGSAAPKPEVLTQTKMKVPMEASKKSAANNRSLAKDTSDNAEILKSKSSAPNPVVPKPSVAAQKEVVSTEVSNKATARNDGAAKGKAVAQKPVALDQKKRTGATESNSQKPRRSQRRATAAHVEYNENNLFRAQGIQMPGAIPNKKKPTGKAPRGNVPKKKSSSQVGKKAKKLFAPSGGSGRNDTTGSSPSSGSSVSLTATQTKEVQSEKKATHKVRINVRKQPPKTKTKSEPPKTKKRSGSSESETSDPSKAKKKKAEIPEVVFSHPKRNAKTPHPSSSQTDSSESTLGFDDPTTAGRKKKARRRKQSRGSSAPTDEEIDGFNFSG
ncbi:expressed unknown protein [Seminavis robusta]|uniref:Uncharacterized protein n=1 Tax=Seminavis robusta TaxID=568900 RepID=A0A9N8H2Y5_9STRA|nr:expressed unknown protein [Seminavis robusta]|eukprot:Sro27_g018060.1 n/a (897) ;mRNA; r:21786-24476